jgi:ubiquinone/menaquinone biosynthesis C-methylase UbiE
VTLTRKKNDQSNIEQGYGLSETAYSYGYDLRLKYSSFMQDILNWMSAHSSELLSENNTKILSLGCGSGLFDSELIKIVQQHNKCWSFKGVDFSATDLDNFRKKLLILGKEIQQNVTLNYQKFTPSVDMGERFDLITMIHFLHSFNDVFPIINNSLRHLSVGGKLLIVQQKKMGIAELKEKFSYLLPNQKFHSSEQVKALLQAKKITFTSYVVNTYFDISVLKEMTLDALVLMSFCLSNDLSVLNTQEQDRIRNAFIFQAREKADGTLILDEQMEVIICQA